MLSLNLDDRISPPAIITEIKYPERVVCILKESKSTIAIMAPAPTEWMEIFHHKLMTVTTRTRKDPVKINDFRKTGIGNLNTIYEVAE